MTEQTKKKVVREIDVRKQVRLPLSKVFSLVRSSILHRLFRSTLTMAVIMLAVAFFMAMLSESVFLDSVAGGVDKEVGQYREPIRRLNFMYDAPSSTALSRRMSTIAEDSDELEEYARVSDMPKARVIALVKQAKREQLYLDFFANLNQGDRLTLIEKNEGRDIFRFLQDETRWLEFVERLRPMSSLRIPGGEEQLADFIKGFAEYIRNLDEFESVWRGKVAALREATTKIIGDKKVEFWLIDAPADKISAWRKVIRESGFDLNENLIERMKEYFGRIKTREEVIALLSTPEKRASWRKTFPTRSKAALEEKLAMLDDEKIPAFLEGRWDAETLREIPELIAHERLLADMEKTLAGRMEKESGAVLSGRQIFLLVISFLMCMVGIASAMLMAITERFREIATMKCLGATDGFIMTQFMLEASFQGVIGGFCGMLVGMLMSFLKNVFLFGGYLIAYFPLEGLALCAVVSLSLGIFLAVLASLYPSWAASRMAPMEAMRIE